MGDARERTALAWTRSALNFAVSGALIARAGFVAHLDGLGVACALAGAGLAFVTWHHGQTLYRRRGTAGASAQQQPIEFALLTAATVLTGAAAVIVTLAV